MRQASLLLLLMTGCLDLGGGSGSCNATNGVADNLNFSYECRGNADPHCDTPGGDVPKAIAREASFRLTAGGGTLEPVSSQIVTSDGGFFRAHRVGPAAFIVRTDGGGAIDGLQLDIVEPETILITGASDDTPLPTHARTSVRAIALDTSKARLAGTLDVDWSSENPEVATVTRRPDQTCDVDAVAPGVARIRAVSGRFAAVIDLHVEDQIPSDAGPSDAGPNDAGGDT